MNEKVQPIIESKLVVKGRVQGVNYREHCRQLAYAHNVTGYAKNLPGGEVEVLVCGLEPRVDGFMESLSKNAPPSAVVREIKEVSRVACEKAHPGFAKL